MSTFPAAIDGSVTPGANLSTYPHSALHTGHQAAIIATQTKVGVDGSAVTTTHDYKLSEVTSTDKAVGKTATQTLSGKTLTTPTIASFTNATHTHNDSAGGGVLTENSLSLTDVTTNNVTTSKHGFITKAPNSTDQYFRGDATWATIPFIIMLGGAVASPVDATTYYGANLGSASSTASNAGRFYIPVAGTITSVYVNVAASGTVGTTETSTLSVRLNDTSDTTISSAVVYDSGAHAYSATGLSIAVAAGDFIAIKLVTATWATNPGTITFTAAVRFN